MISVQHSAEERESAIQRPVHEALAMSPGKTCTMLSIPTALKGEGMTSKVIPGRLDEANPESRDSGLAHFISHSGMTRSASGRRSPHRIDAVGPAARRRQIQTREAEQDRGRTVVDQRKEAVRKVPDEIGERHFTRQDEGDDPREQADHQKRAEHNLDTASSHDQRRRIGELRDCRKLEDFGDTVVKQQQAGDEAQQAERGRLKLRKGLVHVIAPVSHWKDLQSG